MDSYVGVTGKTVGTLSSPHYPYHNSHYPRRSNDLGLDILLRGWRTERASSVRIHRGVRGSSLLVLVELLLRKIVNKVSFLQCGQLLKNCTEFED